MTFGYLEGSVPIGGGLASEEEELAKYAHSLDKTSTYYNMDISAGNTKVKSSNKEVLTHDMHMQDHKLEAPSFKYLGAIITDEG